MTQIIRKGLSKIIVKRILRARLASRRRRSTMEIGDVAVSFFALSYLLFMKTLGKEARLISLTERKRSISREHLETAHKRILQRIGIKRRQRTLDEMLPRRKK